MRDEIRHFTDLIVWQKAHELSLMVYKATKTYPRSELFGIVTQLRRAATSISANIAEGMGRGSYADRARFYYNARGSTYEVENFLIISKSLNYIEAHIYNEISEVLNTTRKLLNGFISKTEKMGGS